MQLPVLPCLNREPSFSQELDEVTETVVSFLKEDDSAGQSPKLGTCVRRVTTEAIMLKLKEKPSKMEKQERVRGPHGSSQEGKPQDSYLGVGTVSSESEASKAYTGVPPTQVRWELFFPNHYLKYSGPQRSANSHAFVTITSSIKNVLEGMLLPVRCMGFD